MIRAVTPQENPRIMEDERMLAAQAALAELLKAAQAKGYDAGYADRDSICDCASQQLTEQRRIGEVA